MQQMPSPPQWVHCPTRAGLCPQTANLASRPALQPVSSLSVYVCVRQLIFLPTTTSSRCLCRNIAKPSDDQHYIPICFVIAWWRSVVHLSGLLAWLLRGPQLLCRRLLLPCNKHINMHCCKPRHHQTLLCVHHLSLLYGSIVGMHSHNTSIHA